MLIYLANGAPRALLPNQTDFDCADRFNLQKSYSSQRREANQSSETHSHR